MIEEILKNERVKSWLKDAIKIIRGLKVEEEHCQ